MRCAVLWSLALLVSCVSRVTDHQISLVKPGMTIEQVHSILGDPWKRVVHPTNPTKETLRYVLQRRHRRPGKTEAGQYHMIVGYREAEFVFIEGRLTDR